MDGLIIFILLVAIIAFWWDSASAYENAYQAARRACKLNEVSLLDDTLARTKLRLCRHGNGYMQFCRQYDFEFSTDGELRYKGSVILNGKVVEKVEMEVYREDYSPPLAG
ncbi:MAG: DUF3301 domain-containing protein [Pseudomonadota bacterium]